MIISYEESGYVLNLSESHYHYNNDYDTSEVEGLLDVLFNVPINRKVKDNEKKILYDVASTDICISPYSFFKKGSKKLNWELALEFLNTSASVCNLHEDLMAAGAFACLDKLADGSRRSVEAFMYRVLCIFAVSCLGPEDAKQIPLKLVHDVVDWFRTSDGLTWRREIVGKNSTFNVQGLRNLILGFARIYDDPSLTKKASSHRQVWGKSITVRALEASRSPLQQDLTAMFRDFKETSRIRPSDIDQVLLHTNAWLEKNFPNKRLIDILKQKDRKVSVSEYLRESTEGKPDYIHSLARTLRKVSDHYVDKVAAENPDTVLYSLISDLELAKLQKSIPARKPNSTRSRPLPAKLHTLIKEILDEGEVGWPGRCGHFDVKVVEDGIPASVYCPVIPTLISNAFDIPLRIGQWRRFDSGEGDVLRFDANVMKWVPNPSVHAGYWANLERAPWEGFPTKGYAHQFNDPVKPITGFWINTNKTGSPYALPWQHPVVHKRLGDLLNWQEKYNPIEEPIGPEKYLDDPGRAPIVTMSSYPTIFPIYRLFPTNPQPWQGRIVTRSEVDKAWNMLLAEGEARWNALNPEKAIQIVSRQKSTGQPQSSIYNLHGIRVRGLSVLYQSGMPIELISKMVAGHATLRMTVYYLRYDPSEIDDLLQRSVANSGLAQDLIDDLKAMNFDQAQKRAVSLNEPAFRDAIGSVSKIEYCNVDIGMCPYEGSRCSDGGPVVHKSKLKGEKHGPVPGGSRNCIQCRHFISGPPWIVQLSLFGSKLCEQRAELGREEEDLNRRVAGLEDRRKSGQIDKQRFNQAYEACEVEMQRLKDCQELLEKSIFNVELFLKASLALMEEAKRGDNPGVKLVAAGAEAVARYEEISKFEHSLTNTEASRHFLILRDDRVEEIRNKYLDTALVNAGILPPRLITRISPEVARDAMDQFAKFLLARASREEIKALEDGSLTLKNLNVVREVREIISKSLTETIGHANSVSVLIQNLDAEVV
ncbi:VPA1269 family protein [Hoeflea sp. 108]|uniref:VPA1269 family protein n=1 Tax=Hoeflea sp. 108 TaxID=1116369 RepID=UPI0003A11478|nr:VPA1269 family protein [Hoeflea sp. 108]